MSSHLPVYLDPLIFAEKGRALEGVYPLSSLPRLEGVLVKDDGQVRFRLAFNKKGRQAVISGSVEANLKLECQVCLGIVVFPVSRKVSLAVAASLEEANLLSDEYEALLISEDEKTVVLKDIIEDELLLALPTIARHDDCKLSDKNDQVDIRPPEKETPFSILENLKKN